MVYQPKEPTAATVAANQAAEALYAMDDWEDFYDVDRGFVVGIDQTRDENDEVVFDTADVATLHLATP